MYLDRGVVEVLDGESIYEVAWMDCADLDVGAVFWCVCISLTYTAHSITLPRMQALWKETNGTKPIYCRAVTDGDINGYCELLGSGQVQLGIYFQNWPLNGGTIYPYIKPKFTTSRLQALSDTTRVRANYLAYLPNEPYECYLLYDNGPGITAFSQADFNAALATTYIPWYATVHFVFHVDYRIDPNVGNYASDGTACITGSFSKGLLGAVRALAQNYESTSNISTCGGDVSGNDLSCGGNVQDNFFSNYFWISTGPNLPLGGGTLTVDALIGEDPIPAWPLSTIRLSRTYSSVGRLTNFSFSVLTEANANVTTIDPECLIVVQPTEGLI
jgi:hypothetical protein